MRKVFLPLVLLLAASLLLMLTTVLALARRNPSRQHEIIVAMTESEHSTLGYTPKIYRYNPANGALTVITSEIWAFHNWDMQDDHHLLVLGRRHSEEGLYRINLWTGELETLLAPPPPSDNANWVPIPIFNKEKDSYVIDTFGNLYLFDLATRVLIKLSANLPPATHADGGYAFSPDRTRIAITTLRDEAAGEIYIMQPDGQQLHKLNFVLEDLLSHLSGWVAGEEEWLILRNGTDYYRLRPDGTGYEALTRDLSDNLIGWVRQSPVWGNWLIVSSPVLDATTLLTQFVVNIDDPTRQWSLPAGTRQIITSPDQSWFVYSVANKLYRVRPDGTDQSLIAQLPSETTILYVWSNGAWSDDGQWLLMVDRLSDHDPQTFYRLAFDGHALDRFGTVNDRVYPHLASDNESLYYTQDMTDRYDEESVDLYQFRLGDQKSRHLWDIAANPDRHYDQFLGWGPVIDRAWSPLILVGLAGLLVSFALGLALPEFS